VDVTDNIFTDVGTARTPVAPEVRARVARRSRTVLSGAKREAAIQPIYQRVKQQLLALALDNGSVRKFDPSEPRDAEGRWTADGGGGAWGGDAATPEEKAIIQGGLTAADYPTGVMPHQPQTYYEYLHPEPDPYGYSYSNPRTMKDLGYSAQWTPEQQATARAALAAQVRDGVPASRLPYAAVKDILADGTVRNQFETGRTGAATGSSLNYEPRRMAAETELLGVPADAKPEDRPVYGYMAQPGTTGDQLHADNPDEVAKALAELPLGYNRDETGNTVYPLSNSNGVADLMANPDDKFLEVTPSRYNANEGDYVAVDSASDRAAQMDDMIAKDPEKAGSWYDMMNKETRFYPLGDGNGGLNTDNVVAFANREWGANQYGDVMIRYDRSLLDQSTVTGGDSIDMKLMGAPAALVEAADPRVPIGMVTRKVDDSYSQSRVGYTEVQMFQHPTLSDITSVTFTGGSKPSGVMQQQMASAGIPWSMDPRPKLSAPITFTDILTAGGWDPAKHPRDAYGRFI
jgi:hypothetical protein